MLQTSSKLLFNSLSTYISASWGMPRSLAADVLRRDPVSSGTHQQAEGKGGLRGLVQLVLGDTLYVGSERTCARSQGAAQPSDQPFLKQGKV